MPTYPGLRIALPNRREIARRIEAAAPDAIHIATEGPIGWAVRAYCRRRKLAFTTSYTTRFPEYVAVRTMIPASVGYAVLRHFHAAASMTMVATASLRQELGERGFRKLGFWTRGVDTELFNPDHPAKLDLPRPIFMTMGRVAVEKNLEAFLSLDLPGTKVVVGDGPQKAAARSRNIRDAVFLGEKKGAGSDRRISPPPTSSCFRASPTRSASCSSRRWPAARRLRHFRSPDRRMSLPIIRSARWIPICAAPACAR